MYYYYLDLKLVTNLLINEAPPTRMRADDLLTVGNELEAWVGWQHFADGVGGVMLPVDWNP